MKKPRTKAGLALSERFGFNLRSVAEFDALNDHIRAIEAEASAASQPPDAGEGLDVERLARALHTTMTHRGSTRTSWRDCPRDHGADAARIIAALAVKPEEPT